jgi:hypothetical protein
MCLSFCFIRTHFKRPVSDTGGQKQSMENQSYVISDNEREQIADQMRKVS